MHAIRKLHLPRRTFLKGVGVSLALPWLEAMVPALSPRRSGQRPARAMFVFAPNGMKMDEWRPAAIGRDFALPPILEPLAPVRGDVSVLSGLVLDAARAHGDGPGDHARACSAFLTCAHPRKVGPIEVGVSVDQVIAAEVGAQTKFASLELGMERGSRAGQCDSGYSCAYSHNVSWRTPTTPVAKESDPRAVFTRLFGGADEQGDRQRRELRSILDAVRADARELDGRLAPADRAKLDEYLTAVRELELRLARAEVDAGEASAVQAPAGLDRRGPFPERLAAMYELIALALQTDVTRTVTFMVGDAGSRQTYGFLGIPEEHHELSHHRGDADKHARIARINRFHIEQFATFLQRLRATDDDGESLLARSMIVYGSGIADGNSHDHGDLPILLAGGGNGSLRLGAHVDCGEAPLADLYLGLLGRLGIQRERFADSRGPLAGLG